MLPVPCAQFAVCNAAYDFPGMARQGGKKGRDQRIFQAFDSNGKRKTVRAIN